MSVQEEWLHCNTTLLYWSYKSRDMLLVSFKHGGDCILSERKHGIEDRNVAAASTDLLHESLKKSWRSVSLEYLCERNLQRGWSIEFCVPRLWRHLIPTLPLVYRAVVLSVDVDFQGYDGTLACPSGLERKCMQFNSFMLLNCIGLGLVPTAQRLTVTYL